ncbi:MAG: hypothetical protein PUB38_09530 [Prevotella sp.]|nr:hypothetical protein [Prevotella sp.]
MKTAKRPVRAKALIIYAFALTGRIVFDGFLPQGVALGYVHLPLRGVLLRLLTYPPPIVFQKDSFCPSKGLVLLTKRTPFADQKGSFCMLKGLHLQSESKVIQKSHEYYSTNTFV